MECLYVAHGTGALVKVGRTGNPAARKSQMRGEFRLRGEQMVDFIPCPMLPSAISLEGRLIGHLRQKDAPTCGREWFRTVEPEMALGLARRITGSTLGNWPIRFRGAMWWKKECRGAPLPTWTDEEFIEVALCAGQLSGAGDEADYEVDPYVHSTCARPGSGEGADAKPSDPRGER